MVLKRALLLGMMLWLALSCFEGALADEPPKAMEEVQKLLDTAARAKQEKHPEEALKLYTEARTRARDLKDRKGEADALRQVGNVSDDLHMPQKALECYSQALPFFTQAGDEPNQASTLLQMGTAYFVSSQFEKDASTSIVRSRYTRSLTIRKAKRRP